MIELDDKLTLPDAQLRQMLLGAIGFERTNVYQIDVKLQTAILATSREKWFLLLQQLVDDGEIVPDRDPDSPMPAFRRVNRF